jgi:hypothetical protein
MPSEQYSLPPAIEPFYRFNEPNQPILLYEGTLEVIQGGLSRRGSGVIELKWFPHPQVEFMMTCYEPLNFNSPQASLRFSEIEAPVDSIISINDRYISGERSVEISGKVEKPITIGSGQALAYLQFHLTNFEDFLGSTVSVIEDSEGSFYSQRAIFEADGWKITIDQLKTTKYSVRRLKATGGYAITHVGKLERVDGEIFTQEESSDILRALADFLSFFKGFRVAPQLLIGYDSNNCLVWKEWMFSNAGSWQNVDSWSWGLTAKSMTNIFPEFVIWWKDWGDAAKRVIYWYVESNTQAGAIEGSCVLEQATLELIIWVYLEADLESDSKLPKQKLKYLSQQINHLLLKQGIPQEIPPDLISLIQLADSQSWGRNGACAFVKVRNNITHSDPTNRKLLNEMPVSARVEAWQLGLWYLELVLLRLFNYRGEYFNRLRRGVRLFGDIERVPWA